MPATWAGKSAIGGKFCNNKKTTADFPWSKQQLRECVRDCEQVDFPVPMVIKQNRGRIKTEVGRNMPRQRSGQIFVEALAPCASLWELVLNDLIDDFVEVPGVCHEGQPPFLTLVNPLCKICLLVVMPWQELWAGTWAGNMPRQKLGHVLYAAAESWAGYMLQQEFGHAHGHVICRGMNLGR
ncbi:hypothetical protein V6N12_066875 [Hibiscus sabdariffa]|uniref:Uncharacterized protein n=1 Tax=Hibiscus sabdariffa TaxID=183260 RepID=A0ABR2C9E7_9ROSI